MRHYLLSLLGASTTLALLLFINVPTTFAVSGKDSDKDCVIDTLDPKPFDHDNDGEKDIDSSGSGSEKSGSGSDN